MTPIETPEDTVTDRAANWLARRDAGFTPADASAFERWLASEPHHARAVAELEAAWSVLQRPRETGHARRVIANLQARACLRHRRRAKNFTWLALGLAAAAAIALAVRLPSFAPPRPAPSPLATIAARPERQTLADGSVVELNLGAEISVAFSPGRRDVKLLRGEAHFAVAKDPARPFIVSAGSVEARAVGTEFSVKFAEEDVQVLVTEGRVAVAQATVAPTGTAAKPVFANAGARVTVPLSTVNQSAPRLDTVSAEEIVRALAWRSRRVEFSGTPLAAAVALFNRQNRLQLSLAEDSLGALRVSGIFRADDPAGFARLIEPTFSLHAHRTGADRIEISR